MQHGATCAVYTHKIIPFPADTPVMSARKGAVSRNSERWHGGRSEHCLGMAAIVDNLIRTKRAAAVLADNARKAAALPMEIFFAGMTGNNEVVFEWCVARTVSARAHLFGLTC